VRTIILNTISSAEFHHKLQSGQFQEVLSMISSDPTLLERGFSQELDVTTRSISGDTTAERTVNNGYLRTKINLVTGEIHNEVSDYLLLDRASYTNLQQLHTERIDASYRIVRGHLDRLKAILTALSPAIQQLPVASDKAKVATAPHESLAAMSLALGELDEIDLSLPSDNEIWEEWVEDDDFQPKSSASPVTTAIEELKLPDLQEHWVRRPLSPIDVKPIVPRSTTISSDPIERWEKFVPEYIEIDAHHRSTKTG
jgi:hypothetical protein